MKMCGDRSKTQVVKMLLKYKHTITLVLRGQSMYPTIKDGDFVVVGECLAYDLRLNDIVVFFNKDYPDDVFDAHRVVRFTSDLIVTKGDNNNFEDAPISMGEILGIVLQVYDFNTNMRIYNRK